jgi:hypothetical protein
MRKTQAAKAELGRREQTLPRLNADDRGPRDSSAARQKKTDTVAALFTIQPSLAGLFFFHPFPGTCFAACRATSFAPAALLNIGDGNWFHRLRRSRLPRVDRAITSPIQSKSCRSRVAQPSFCPLGYSRSRFFSGGVAQVVRATVS